MPEHSSLPRQRFPRVRRLGRRGVTLLGTLALIGIGLFISTRPGMVLADVNDDLFQTIKEGRGLGFPGNPQQQIFQGTRWIIDPLALVEGPVWRAIERTAGIDITKSGRDENLIESNLSRWVSQKGISEAERQFLQSDIVGSLVASRDLSPRGLTEEQEDAQYNQQGFSWDQFLSEDLPPDEHPLGRSFLARSTAIDKLFTLKDAIETVQPDGTTTAEFFDERTPQILGQSSHRPYQPSPSPPPNLDRILRSAGQTQEVLKQIQKAPYDAILNNPYPHNPIAATNPDQQIPSILGNEQAQRLIQSVAFGSTEETSGAAAGVGNQLVNVAPAGNPLSESSIEQALLDQIAARTALAGQQLAANRAAGGAFFGPSTFGRLSNAFSPETFQNLLGNLFQGGGGSGGGAGGGGGSPPGTFEQQVPVNQNEATDPACPLPNAQLSAREAAGVALLLGLPRSPANQPAWTATYLSSGQLAGIEGTNLASGAQRTLSPTDFGGANACVWVIGTRKGPNQIQLVAIEDRLAQTATRIELSIP